MRSVALVGLLVLIFVGGVVVVNASARADISAPTRLVPYVEHSRRMAREAAGIAGGLPLPMTLVEIQCTEAGPSVLVFDLSPFGSRWFAVLRIDEATSTPSAIAGLSAEEFRPEEYRIIPCDLALGARVLPERNAQEREDAVGELGQKGGDPETVGRQPVAVAPRDRADQAVTGQAAEVVGHRRRVAGAGRWQSPRGGEPPSPPPQGAP